MNFIPCYLLHGIVNTNIIMKLQAKVTLVFKNKEGKKLELQTTVKDMLEKIEIDKESESLSVFSKKEPPTKNKFVIIDLKNMDYMKNEDGYINFYDTMDDACETCGMYEFEDVWVMRLMYNHKESDI